MTEIDTNNPTGAESKLLDWKRTLERLSLVFAGAACGVLLYLALFPAFYYMMWAGLVPALWIAVLIGHTVQTWILLLVAASKKLPLPTNQGGNGKFLLSLVVLVTFAVGLKLPLHFSFLLARPGLEESLAAHSDDLSQVRHASHDYGLYQIGRAERYCHNKDRIYFRFQNDSESAMIYSESGIDDLCYNSGNKGHLFGNWYWMKED